MLFLVTRAFKNIDGSFLRVGDCVECDQKRALVLQKNGIIGSIVKKETAINNNFEIPEKENIETATEKPAKRQYRKRAK